MKNISIRLINNKLYECFFSWYHGPINRLEAEKALYGEKEGSYLVRGNKGSYALSIK